MPSIYRYQKPPGPLKPVARALEAVNTLEKKGRPPSSGAGKSGMPKSPKAGKAGGVSITSKGPHR